MSNYCGSCFYWEEHNPGREGRAPREGYCRRNPPVVLPDHSTIFPLLLAKEWCGLWDGRHKSVDKITTM